MSTPAGATGPEVWEARAFERFMTDGRTRPALLSCGLTEGGTEKRTRAVVKGVGHPEVQGNHLGFEMVGTILARAFGCNVPRPLLVNLSAEFLEAAAASYQAGGFLPPPGIAFGSELVENFTPVFPHAKCQPEHLGSAARAFAFDMAIQNVDRRTAKTNCGIVEAGIVLFDFEKAFSFLVPVVGGAPKPWAVSEFGFQLDHVFYRWLKGEPIDWAWVPAALEATASAAEELSNVVPSAWQGPLTEIVQHVATLRLESARFVDGLKASLQ